MLRSALYADAIVANIASFCKEHTEERGSLLTEQAPVGLVVVDVMRAIGLPENTIRMVLGRDLETSFEVIDDGEDCEESYCQCANCGERGSVLVQTIEGPRFSCVYCADRSGLMVI